LDGLFVIVLHLGRDILIRYCLLFQCVVLNGKLESFLCKMPIFVPCYGNIYNLPDDGSSDDKNHFRPESSVFSLFMNGSSFLSGLCTYFRFRQVQHYQTKSTNINHIWKLNVVSLLFSIISSIGLLIVANFQEAKR